MLAPGSEYVAPIEVDTWIERFELDRLRIVGNGAIPLSGSLIRNTTADIRVGELWVDLYCLCVIDNRCFAVALMQRGDGTVVVGFGISRIDLDCFAVVGDCQIVVAFGLECGAAI
jgi:hypothetical protein